MDLGGWLAQLVDHGMFDSACLLGEVLLIPPGPEQGSAAVGFSPLPSTEAYVLYADALVGRGEHRRALTYYQEGLRSLKVPRGGGSGIAGASPATPAADGSLQFNECEIKLRIARAHVALKETRNALSCLEGITLRLRSAAASLLLARLYQSTGNERAAASAYKEAVRATPVPIEAAIALAQLGVQVGEVLALQPQLAQLPWLLQLLHAHAAAGAHDPARAHSSFLALGGHFGASSHVLLQCARAASLRGRTDEAIGLYQRARELDGALLDGMDRYAACLAERERRAPPAPDAKPAGAGSAQLGRLCRELLATDKGRPEPWVAIGIYWAARGDRARALEDCERALSIDDRHVPAHQLKGVLLLGLARPEQAVYVYRKANAIRPELESFVGLVDAYLRVERPREALSAAREASQLMPNSARAHALVGRVHLSCPGAHDRAKRAFNKALALEPQCEETVVQMAKLKAAEKDYAAAIALLQPLLHGQTRDAIHARLGDMHALRQDFTQALAHYHHALALNGSLSSAAEGLERMEKMIRAVDRGDGPSHLSDDDNESARINSDVDSRELGY